MKSHDKVCKDTKRCISISVEVAAYKKNANSKSSKYKEAILFG